ncbi:MAG: HIT domain-containing protein [Terracoccus sp.]
MSEDCLFCRIVSGEPPTYLLAESARSIAFRDISPQAPVHVLVVSRRHEPNIGALADASSEDLADVFALVSRVAQAEGVAQNHRLVFNTGAGVGQTIFHAHAHVLGGASFVEHGLGL